MPPPSTKAVTLSEARTLMPLPGDGGPAPTEFCLFRYGLNETVKGTFLFDEESAASVMERYAARKLDLMFDYEHQSLANPPIIAPASVKKWIPQVRNRELWATDIKWTDRARDMIEAGEYRYFSPAFRHEDDSMRVVEMINVALTNLPAMDDIAPLVAARAGDDTMPMDYEKLYNELKAALAAKVDECTALSAQLTALKGAAKDPDEPDADDMKMSVTAGLSARARRPERLAAVEGLAGLRTNVRKLTGSEDDQTALGVLTAWKRNADEHAKAIAELAAVKTEKLTSEAMTLLEQAGKDGKIAPAERPYWEGVVREQGSAVTEKGLTMLKGYVATAVPKVATVGLRQKDGGGVMLSETEIAIARQNGTDVSKLQEWKAKQLQNRG